MDGTPRGRTGPLAGRELLELACERLEEIAFFGLRERYADSVRLLAHTFHWEPFRRIPHLNATGTRNDRSRLDPEELESARELNRLDLELYRFAGDLFRGRLDTLPVARATPPPDGTGVPAS